MIAASPRTTEFQPSLRISSAWSIFGHGVYAACQWGILIVLAKLGSPELVGQFAIGLAIGAPIMMFSNLQLRAVQSIDVGDRYSFQTYLTLRAVTTAIALIAVLGIAFFSGYRSDTLTVIIVVALAKSFESISDVIFGLFQRHEDLRTVALSLALKGVLSLGLLAVLLYSQLGGPWALLSIAATFAVGLFAFDVAAAHRLLARRLALALDRNCYRLALVGLPLGLVMMLISLNTNLPRYFIEHLAGGRELGVFAALAYIPVSGNLVINSVGQATSSRLALYYSSGNRRRYTVLLGQFVGTALVCGLALIVACDVGGSSIVRMLYGAAYDRAELLNRMAVAGAIGFAASALGFGMTAARYLRIQPLVFGVTVATTAIASYFLIPKHQLMGAATAGLLGSCVQLLLATVVIGHALFIARDVSHTASSPN